MNETPIVCADRCRVAVVGESRITGIALNGSPLIGLGDYEPLGPVSVWQWGNGHKTYRDHDQDGRLVTWEYRNGTSILRRDLTWDNANRITAITDPASAANSSTYGYDVLDRLTSALAGTTPATSRGYGYDAIGNRTTSTLDAASTTYAYPPTSHRLTSLSGATTKSYTYDGAGNPTQAGLLAYGYNLANRMASVSGGASATYQINALGQRVTKTIGGTTTRYVYDEQGRLIGEYDQSGSLVQETVWLDDLPIATLRPTGTGNPTPIAVYYVHADHLGSPRAITRPSDDAILWRWDNDEPFGNNPANENPAGLGNFRYDLRFPGQQYDAETGTHYNYFRDYEPGIGRYLQSDPIGVSAHLQRWLAFRAVRHLPQFVNQLANFGHLDGYAFGDDSTLPPLELSSYAYAANNPQRWTDPTGESIGGGIGGHPISGSLQCNDPKREKNCAALRDNIINQTCKSISNPRKKMACFAAAWATYLACLAED